LLKLYHDTLIGYQQVGITDFGLYGQDTQEIYKSNLCSQSQDWIYRNKSVSYNRNSFGHRSKEIDMLDRDFVLFLGCSITVGSAVALEDTFAYIVSKELKIDYYNLAVEGSGPDLILFNLVKWMLHIKKIPKVVILQWPEIFRTFRQEGDDVIPLGPWGYRKNIKEHKFNHHWNDYEKLIMTDHFTNLYTLVRTEILALLKSYNVPIFEINQIPFDDYGRDLKHPGIKSHRLIADQVLSESRKLINLGQ
jgi:hypothetical protein